MTWRVFIGLRGGKKNGDPKLVFGNTEQSLTFGLHLSPFRLEHYHNCPDILRSIFQFILNTEKTLTMAPSQTKTDTLNYTASCLIAIYVITIFLLFLSGDLDPVVFAVKSLLLDFVESINSVTKLVGKSLRNLTRISYLCSFNYKF